MFDRKTYSRDYYSKKRKQRKADGRCVTCGATLTAECTTLQCERCREKQKYANVSKVNIQKLIAEAKTDTVHKTIAAVKIKCSRVAYSDMATGHMKESFVIKAQDLDEIEKELTDGKNH